MKTYDVNCYELAKHFLQDEPELDTPEKQDALAAHIQESVEDWFELERKAQP